MYQSKLNIEIFHKEISSKIKQLRNSTDTLTWDLDESISFYTDDIETLEEIIENLKSIKQLEYQKKLIETVL